MQKLISGRMHRQPYIVAQFVFLAVLFVYSCIYMEEFANWDGQSLDGQGSVIMIGVALFLIFAAINLVFTIRRFHDLDRSTVSAVGWYCASVLLAFPVFYLFYLTICKKGTDGANQYGPDPLA